MAIETRAIITATRRISEAYSMIFFPVSQLVKVVIRVTRKINTKAQRISINGLNLLSPISHYKVDFNYLDFSQGGI
jgi:hypothetical protein